MLDAAADIEPGTVPAPAVDKTLVIYDGECVFCSNYVKLLKLRETVGKVELINARSDDPRIKPYWDAGYDLNEGMIFAYQGRTYFGDEAVNMMALLSSDSSLFNRLNRLMLSNRQVAAFAYPILRFGRNMTLKVRGQKKLESQA
jgi:predicted DCC family thiol-disulfide oxidoreductase YuxK